MYSRHQSLRHVTGLVAEVQMHKAIVAFGHDGKQNQALLKKEKLTIGGRHVNDESLLDVLPIGSVVKFWCHRIPGMKLEDCAWFVTHAYKQDYYHEEESMMATASVKQTAEFMPGLHRMSGTILELNDRHGVILSDNGSGDIDDKFKVFFTASKLILFGKTVTQKQKLPELIQVGDNVNFDAIPMFPQEINFKSCPWFATLVWRGQRPIIRNASVVIPKEVGLKNLLTNGKNLQFFLYQIACDSKAMFVKTEARVMFLINSEFGVALIFMKPNVLTSALFHKSVCYLFGHNMRNCDLQKFLKEGDRITFVGVEAPSGLIAKFVATHIIIQKQN